MAQKSKTAKKSTRKSSVNSVLAEACKSALRKYAEFVHHFPYVKNPVTQSTQRGVNGTLRINGEDTTIESDGGWLPARRYVKDANHGKGGFEFNKRFASAILGAYESGSVSDPIAEVKSLLVYLGLSVNSSRPRSLEGSMKAEGILILEGESGLTIQDDSTRQSIVSFVEYLENSIKANMLAEVRGKRVNRATDLGI